MYRKQRQFHIMRCQIISLASLRGYVYEEKKRFIKNLKPMIEHLITFAEAAKLTGLKIDELLNNKDLEIRKFERQLCLTYDSVIPLIK